MRLLKCNNNGKLAVSPDLLDKSVIPPYAILSHTWEADQEVTFDDAHDEATTRSRKSGYAKLDFCLEQARRDGLQYVWVDTCCIYKTDQVELQAALNSMFRWYRDAKLCYVYLSDVSTSNGDSFESWGPAFRASRWFTRGWTLQELLAPKKLQFFSREGNYLGDRRTLEQEIHDITGIALTALRGAPLSSFSVDERLSWIADRDTTREEDKAYSLFGLFDVFIPLLYGESEKRAFARLREAIEK